MKRLNILVLTQMGRGHVYPVIPLCHELSKRGHNVIYPTNSSYFDDIEKIGARGLLFKSSLSKTVDDWWNGLADVPFDSPKWFSQPEEWIHSLHLDTNSLDTATRLFFGSTTPDIVLYDQYFYPGYVVARRLGCPRVRISAHFANYKNLLIRRNGVCLNTQSLLTFAKRVSRFLMQEGVVTGANFWPLEGLNIHFIPDAFQYHRAFFDDRYCFAGHSTNRHFPRKWLDKNSDVRAPIVLIAGLSGLDGHRIDALSYLGPLVEALADSEFHCILLSEYEQVFSASLPRNFDACPGVSPLEVLPHAAVFVCHGGMGSTLEAIYCGVPVLAIPSHPSADEIAYRVAELGIGLRMLRQDLSAERIRESISTLVWNERLTKRVKEMRSAFERSAGIAGACDRIERFGEAI